MSLESMRMTYYSYIHSLLSYGIIFWGNAPHNESKGKKVMFFPLQALEALRVVRG
jgi:hypothetical protein